jgi:O-acetyl-ADP-ribose deacetylase (regulator of RNase III)
MELRKQFDVSSEAIFLRVVRLTDQPCAMFVASRDESEGSDGSYQIDYALGSRAWAGEPPKGLTLPAESVVSECTAIGYTAKRDEEWAGVTGKLHVECVGIPPYPVRRYPRVVGLATARTKGGAAINKIVNLKGDATDPRGDGPRIVAHVVNDKTPTWGAGFALAVRRKWPAAQEDFQHWARSDPRNLALGNTHRFHVQSEISVFHMVGQHGYGPSAKPRIRYQALHRCLTQLADAAHSGRASVHMPRIGCGEAGGDWGIVSELIDEALCKQGVTVTVYDLPGSTPPTHPPQKRLF